MHFGYKRGGIYKNVSERKKGYIERDVSEIGEMFPEKDRDVSTREE